jgi:hypothetical protein
MNRKPKVPMNAEFAGIDAALKRAAKAAHALARKTKTPCYIWENGQIIDLTQRRKQLPKTSK